MFFIHGGAFYAGTQIKMGPERLGDVADIVLVAINYRVGPLGIDNIVIRLRIWLKAYMKITSTTGSDSELSLLKR